MASVARSLSGVLGVGSLRLWQCSSSIVKCSTRSFSSSSSSSGISSSSSSVATQKQESISAPVFVEGRRRMAFPPELLNDVVKQLEEDGPKAVKLAVRDYHAAKLAETTELSVIIADDKYLQKLNKKWLGKDRPTDVLSFPQNQAPGESPLLLLGDVVISLETAEKQAQERNHSLLDEVRILLVHGLLHVLGYDHERGAKASEKMEQEEEFLLKSLGWKGKGLISSSQADADSQDDDEPVASSATAPVARQKRSPFKILFCDMDGTLLNSDSKISKKNAASVRAAMSAGVQVIIATGKTRGATIQALKDVGLSGEAGVASTAHPGVFVQGLLVYGPGGSLVHREVLPREYCLEAFNYGLTHKVPVCGFCGDRIVAPFEDPFLGYLHEHFLEPKADILSSLDDVEKHKIQKILFGAKQEMIDKMLKPYFRTFTKGQATLVQAQEALLEILPAGGTKGDGVRRLLERLEVDPDEVMAIGDGENDLEMLQMAGWGVAMGNGAACTLEIADATVSSNDEDGVAEAIERFVLP